MHFLLGRCARRLDDLESATLHLNRAADLGWPEQQIQDQKSLLQLQLGQFSQADTHLNAVINRGADDLLAEEIYEARAKGFMRTYRLADARFCLSYWMEWKPTAAAPHLMMAEIFEKTNDVKAAEAEYRKVLESKPHLPGVHRKLADCLVSLQRLSDAKEAYRTELALNAGDVDSQIGLAKCHRQLAELDDSISLFNKLLKSKLSAQQRTIVLVELAQIAISDHRKPQEALDLLKQALEISPYSQIVHSTLGLCYQKLGDSASAKKHSELAIEIRTRLNRLIAITRELYEQPDNADLRVEAGMLYMQQGMKRAGADWIITALLYKPRHRRARLALAEYYDSIGEPQIAAKHRELAASGP